ncbi:MAG TPA: DNA-binding protein [Gammaproteobacteria bacterium]|nr:DNA-binding protein [Gammaproteobacteria bacterium]
MAFFNLGKKDKYGKQKRIEHRGKNLRISRTGGVALRKQAKAAGLTVTANSKHGLRVSKGVSKGTQVALQNGRFVLRGRYGRGPMHLNLSKSGVSVSARNSLGTFNLLKPNRSSVKIAGVQLRGKKAANIQMIFILGMLLLPILLGLAQVLGFILQAIGRALAHVLSWIGNVPQQLSAALARRRNRKIKTYLSRTEQLFKPAINQWTHSQLHAALLLVLTGWGRGLTAHEAAARLDLYSQKRVTTQNAAPALDISAAVLNDIAQQLESVRSAHEDQVFANPHAITALFAQQLLDSVSEYERVDAFLNIDDWVVAIDQRTVLQEELLEIFADFAQLSFQAAEPQIIEPQAPEPNTQNDASTAYNSNSAMLAHTASAHDGLINLNTASFEQLRTLPHIGFDRALDIMSLRPITHLSQLRAIKGIGPVRLADIKQAGVVL